MKKLIRPAMLILPLCTGMFFPQAAFLAGAPYNFIRWALGVMIFCNVLQINFADLKVRKEHFAVLGVNILMGVIPFYILKFLLPSGEIYSHAAFFAGIAPTATSAAVIVSLLNGDVGFAVTGFLVTNIGISLVLLLLIPLISGDFSASFMLNVLWSIISTIIIPMGCARIIRHVYPEILNHRDELKNLTLVLWSASLFVIAAVARKYFDQNAGASLWSLAVTGVIAAVVCALNFTIGYFLSRGKFRKEASQILGQKNTTFAISLAIEYSSGIAALSAIFYVLFHNLWNSLQLLRHHGKGN